MKRSAAALLLGLFGAAAAAAGAAGETVRERTAAIGESIDWSYRDDGGPVRYRVDGIVLTLDRGRDPEDPGLTRAELRVEVPGYPPVQVHGTPTASWDGIRVGAGRWDPERPFVIFQSFTGGAHCCTEVQVVVPEAGRLRAIHLGTWDGDFMDLPTDVDGDGALDFVVRDNRFLYAFSSYAESDAPPQVWNVENGRPVDVSAEPRYRPLFAAAMDEIRPFCLEGNNSPCAAYVAAAARAGDFERAWREMLEAYDRTRDDPAHEMFRGTEMEACDRAQGDPGGCTFPQSLRRFLVETGYISG